MFTTKFYELEVGTLFKFRFRPGTFTKTSKSTARRNDGTSTDRIHPFHAVYPVKEERPWNELYTHTTEFTTKQLAGVIEAIVQRTLNDYPDLHIDPERLTKGLYCAHRAKPIRMIALLNTCFADFPRDVIMGVYRHYDPKTDTMKGGWTAQHSEPHIPFSW